LDARSWNSARHHPRLVQLAELGAAGARKLIDAMLLPVLAAWAVGIRS